MAANDGIPDPRNTEAIWESQAPQASPVIIGFPDPANPGKSSPASASNPLPVLITNPAGSAPQSVTSSGQLTTNYSFDGVAGTVTLFDHPALELAQVLLIAHLATGRVLRGGSVTGGVVTLTGYAGDLATDDALAVWVIPTTVPRVDIGRITEDNSAIAVRNRSQEYGPFTLTLMNDVTPPLDMDRFLEVYVDYDLDNTKGDFVAFEFSTDGTNWTQITNGGYRGVVLFGRIRRWFRVKRITTSVAPIIVNRIALRATPSGNGTGVVGFPFPTIAMGDTMSGLNGLMQPLSSTRSVNDGANGDLLLGVGAWLMNGLNTWEKKRTQSSTRNVSAAATGSTAAWTPTVGKKFRLMRYMLEVSANASLATAGVLTISLTDAAAVMNLVHKVALAATAGTGAGVCYQVTVDLDNGRLSSAINNVLNLNLSAALTTGTVNLIALGMEE